MRNTGQWRRTASLLAALAGPIGIPHSAIADESSTVRAIVYGFAEEAIQRGVAIGVGVGVVDARSGFAQTYTFGEADAASGDPFRADTIFAIGSNTKVFTTNLLGQAVFESRLRLDNTLSQFQRAFGMFVDPLTSLVSLGELGDFTAGFRLTRRSARMASRRRRPVAARRSARRAANIQLTTSSPISTGLSRRPVCRPPTIIPITARVCSACF
jgi:CubicO group peptidase (beta-lactamase class C family)